MKFKRVCGRIDFGGKERLDRNNNNNNWLDEYVRYLKSSEDEEQKRDHEDDGELCALERRDYLSTRSSL